MDNARNLIEDVSELKENISNEYISPEEAISRIREMESSIKSSIKLSGAGKYGALKSLMITFNVSNFSDMTVFFAVKGTNCMIIERTGDTFLCGKVEEFLEDAPGFYRDLERIEIGGEYYRLFFESMTTDDTIYTVMSLTTSSSFRSTRFHILCDLLMDYIRSAKEDRRGLFNDLFDDIMIDLTRFISVSDENEPVVFFFRYEYISAFFTRIGLATIIEMSGHIKQKLIELFGNEAAIIRLSLSSYVVVLPGNAGITDLNKFTTRNRINFIFKGIVLPYTVVQVPYKKENSIYDIFENVYLLNNYIRDGDVRI